MAACLALAATVASCGAAPAAETPPPAISTPSGSSNWVCRGLAGHFLGLPAAAPEGEGPAPVTGRWWLRGCELGLIRGLAGRKELQIHLEGPGWYWIDFDEGDFELHQQVPFELSADIVGTVRFGSSGSVLSLWFEPTQAANVRVEASTDLELHGATAWGSLLRRVPLLPIRRLTAQRLSKSATAAFGAQIRRGMTITYDLAKDQADMALGLLRPGETPERWFEDDSAWIENDRLLLPARATQVFGPLEPVPLLLDVVVQRGPGIRYRALCTREMPARLDDIATGAPERIVAAQLVANGTIVGSGSHSAKLVVTTCPHYLVVSSAGAETALVALRLRPGPS
jgi:hypothetical protein